VVAEGNNLANCDFDKKVPLLIQSHSLDDLALGIGGPFCIHHATVSTILGLHCLTNRGVTRVLTNPLEYLD